jgi:hypothetical protein
MPYQPSDNDRYNAGYFGIPVEWMQLHNHFMKAYFDRGSVKWPQELTNFCEAVYRRTGFCGDVMACAVADWMKEKGEVTVQYLIQEYGL